MSKILLLEDDPSLAKSLIKYLERYGCSVDWAHDGEEAMELSYNESYTLYLFDMNVPLLSGVDLLSALRHAEDFTPAIIISAQVDVDSVTQGFRAGADDYVKKPFDPEELLVRIRAKMDVLKESIKVKDYTLSVQENEIAYQGEVLRFGEVQNRILVALMKHYPNPVLKTVLLDILEKPTDTALRVNMNKLKKRVALEIESVRGVGYKIT